MDHMSECLSQDWNGTRRNPMGPGSVDRIVFEVAERLIPQVAFDMGRSRVWLRTPDL
ncbi:MAG: hypothetical protein JWL86_2117 [Rhizobium sp.]|nr:hypothetical protein [Rhizobium sp.]